MTNAQRGFALFIVLLAMGFLALLGTQIVAAGRTDTRRVQNLGQAAVLEAAANGAVAHAAFALLAAGDPNFRPGTPPQDVRIGDTPVLVSIRNEADRVNLNTGSLALLQSLITELGTPPIQAAHLAAAILDWRTGGDQARPNGAKTAQYRAAGLPYGPPGEPFGSIDELRGVLGMTPGLFAAMAPHVTVLTDSDPDLSTADPVVARALVDASGVAQDTLTATPGNTDLVLRVTATAIGAEDGRYTLVSVVTGDFRGRRPAMRTLFRERCMPVIGGTASASCP